MSDFAERLPQDRELIPRALIRACVFLIFATIGIVAFATFSDRPKAGTPAKGVIAAERLISVDILPRGAANIFDGTGVLIHEFPEGEAGFMDSVFRAVAYERKKSGVEEDGPVRIARLEDGRHILIDPNSNWRMELRGYGANNMEPFVILLQDL
ncbi:MAG: photosynthetic complex assembly protein PuhC [Pseudomonadota bacterium]